MYSLERLRDIEELDAYLASSREESTKKQSPEDEETIIIETVRVNFDTGKLEKVATKI